MNGREIWSELIRQGLVEVYGDFDDITFCAKYRRHNAVFLRIFRNAFKEEAEKR